MKKSLSILLAILIPFLYTYAQDDPIRFGAKLGYTHSNVEMPVKDIALEGFAATRNFHLGVMSEINLKNALGLKLELLYSQKGGESFFVFDNNNPDSPQKDEQLRFNFVTLPVLLTYQYSNFQLEGGIETAFRQSTKLIVDGIKNKINSPNNRFDFGLNVGVNYLFDSFLIGFRYNHGLNAMPLDLTFTDENGAPLTTQPTFLNRAWQFSIGYRL